MSQMAFGGEWTRQKLEILRRYLEAYTTALKDQPFKLIYIDAFAGDGYWRPGTPYTIEDYGDFSTLLRGSARLALAIDNKPFDRFHLYREEPTTFKLAYATSSRTPEAGHQCLKPGR